MTTRILTEDERQLLLHLERAKGGRKSSYPITRAKSGWTWGPWRSIKGPPTTFKTKAEAVASFESYVDVLLDALRDERIERDARQGMEIRARLGKFYAETGLL